MDNWSKIRLSAQVHLFHIPVSAQFHLNLISVSSEYLFVILKSSIGCDKGHTYALDPNTLEGKKHRPEKCLVARKLELIIHSHRFFSFDLTLYQASPIQTHANKWLCSHFNFSRDSKDHNFLFFSKISSPISIQIQLENFQACFSTCARI